jgi:hydrogenase expression/formation protein HypE
MTTIQPLMDGAACPLPLPHQEMIVLGHGSGGKMMHDLIVKNFLPHFDNPVLSSGDDAGLVNIVSSTIVEKNTSMVRLAISTDSHVVWPLFFQGGDIGKLAVCGTVNDIAMLGAKPQYLTAGFILEEGLKIDLLNKIILSMKDAASTAGVQIIAGDTKVVQKGKADGIYINTTGIGIIPNGINISGSQANSGDVVILTGTIGDHGIAVLEARGELGFQSGIQSDVAPLNHMVAALLDSGCRVHVLRDPTRGGLATSLNEIANQSQAAIIIDEASIPIHPAVIAASEMLGLDPLYIANEGKMIVIIHPDDAQKAIGILQKMPHGTGATVIGRVEGTPKNRVLMRTLIGGTRILNQLSGELLPRIC